MTDRMLIKGGIVLTQDPALGEMPGADVLIEDDKIAAVGHGLSADGARTIDATGDIVIPGFIDTHRHTWETSIRTSAPDFALITYFGSILDKFAPHYRPDDVYAGNLWGSLECINAGITTLVDWSHIINTPEHADAGIRGLQESKIRSVYAYGFGNTSLVDWWFGPDYAGSVLTSDGPDARRIRKQYFNSDDGRITMALATRGPNFCKPDVVRHDWELAKELGLNITVHVAMDRFGYTKMQMTMLRGHGPALPEHDLRPRLALHRRGVGARPRLRRERLVRAADRGPDGPRLGARGDRAGVRPADRPVVRRGDDRAIRPVHPDALDLRLGARAEAPGGVGRRTSTASRPRPGSSPRARSCRGRRIGGAEVAGIADRTGSLTPGKQADIVIIDGSAVNVAPIIDPVGAVVCAADVSNVKTVMVAGEILKEDFRLKADLGAPRKAVEALARLPRLEVRRSGAGLGGQGHRLDPRVTPPAAGAARRVPAVVPRSAPATDLRGAKRATGP